MSHNLIRYQHTGDFHFVIFSCYHRLPYLVTPQARGLFEQSLESMRLRYDFVVAAYVVMPERLQQSRAISDASYLKIMAGSAVTFFFLQLAPFVGMIGVVGLWFLELAIPFMTIRWWIRYAKLNSGDAEFARARRIVLWLGGGVSLFFLLLNLARLLH